MENWNFDKLPETEYNRTIEAYNLSDWRELLKIHNEFNLSKNDYCCYPGQAMLNWFGWAIQNEIIYETGD